MSNLIKLISILLVSFSIIVSNLNVSFNLNVEAKTKDDQSVSKKQIKKKLNLNYTDPRFETDLNTDQKSAILKSLKRWKGELPIDNLFTVTSIASLKSSTNDENKQHKKINKNIADALVVYMWSQTPNPDFDPKNPGDGEKGDPRYIRTQFNVLLKQNKNGSWKASLERDPETKIESVDITETNLDEQIYKDLFATDKADNGFTATEEVLIDDNAADNIQETKKSNTITNTKNENEKSQTITTQKPSISSIAPVVVTPIIEDALKSELKEKKTSWLNNILGIGSIKVSAGVSEISWPWTNGESWQVTQGWHECQGATSNATSDTIGLISGCALDISYVNTGASNVIKAPITSTITRFCQDPVQSVLNFGDKMSITHIKTSSLTTAGGAFVRKADTVGTVFDPGPINPSDTANWILKGLSYRYTTKCGATGGAHIHVKFPCITDPNTAIPTDQSQLNSRNLVGNVTVDGIAYFGPKDGTRGDGVPARTDGLQNYNPITPPIYQPLTPISYYNFTSQNTPNTNNYSGKIKAISNPNLIFDIKDFNGGNNAPVIIATNNTAGNAENQLWSYDNINKQIKGMNGKCLDLGVTINTPDRGLKMQDCILNNSNQKWTFNYFDQIVSLANTANCVEALGGIINNSTLVINPCSASNSNQKWNFSEIATLPPRTYLNVRVNLSGAWNNTTKLMNTDLNTNNTIPLNQPYCTAPWNYCGTENIPNRANIDPTAVDWVLIEIKNSVGTTIQKRAALITKDAYLTSAAGIYSPASPNQFFPILFDSITTPGNYKVIVRHRNHLAIATDLDVTLTPGTVTYVVDLRNNVNVKASGQSLLGTINNVNVYGIRFGDVNSDGSIDSADRTIVGLSSEATNVYSKNDVNLDSSIDSLDRT